MCIISHSYTHYALHKFTTDIDDSIINFISNKRINRTNSAADLGCAMH